MKPAEIFWIVLFILISLLYLNNIYFVMFILCLILITIITQFVGAFIDSICYDIKEYKSFVYKPKVVLDYVFYKFNIFYYLFLNIKLFNNYLNEKFS